MLNGHIHSKNCSRFKFNIFDKQFLICLQCRDTCAQKSQGTHARVCVCNIIKCVFIHIHKHTNTHIFLICFLLNYSNPLFKVFMYLKFKNGIKNGWTVNQSKNCSRFKFINFVKHSLKCLQYTDTCAKKDTSYARVYVIYITCVFTQIHKHTNTHFLICLLHSR